MIALNSSYRSSIALLARLFRSRDLAQAQAVEQLHQRLEALLPPRCVGEPPPVALQRQQVPVDVLQPREFKQPGVAVSDAEAALLDAEPRRARRAVRVDGVVNDH